MATNNKEFNSVDIDKIVPVSDANGMKSLFEEGAYIDLGKGEVNKWKEYNFDDNKKEFVLNKITNPLNGYDEFVKIDNVKNKISYTIDDIVSFTEKYEQMVLGYQHFAYCSRLGFFPNNRLVTLRRFRGAVGDDIYQPPANYEALGQFNLLKPVSTMVTWLKDDEGVFGSEKDGFNFGIGFSEYNDGFVNTLKKSFAEYTALGNSGVDAKQAGWKDSLTNFAITSFLKDGDNTKVDGTELGRFAANNPNMIGQAKRMDSLSSTISFSLTFEYQMRYISGIDPTIAMIDLLSTAMHMGGNESEFRYNVNKFVGNSDIAKNFYKLKYNNTASVAKSFMDIGLNDVLTNTIKVAKNSLEKIKEGIGNFIEDVSGKQSKKEVSLTTEIAKHIFDRYREDLKAAISVDTGLPSGGWHVMIGDPRNPFISCGDLVVGTDCNVKFGKELGPGGFPTSFSVTYTLTQARPRGRQEIMRIFNGGRGRVYTYKATKDNPDYGIFK